MSAVALNGQSFSAEQKEYLSGLFAGVAARGIGFGDVAPNPAGESKPPLDDLIFEDRVKRDLHPLEFQFSTWTGLIRRHATKC